MPSRAQLSSEEAIHEEESNLEEVVVLATDHPGHWRCWQLTGTRWDKPLNCRQADISTQFCTSGEDAGIINKLALGNIGRKVRRR